jgi:hypothetical protein
MTGRHLAILIVTTRSDSSLEYFLQDNVYVAYFEDAVPAFVGVITTHHFDIVYLRDPFNTGILSLETIATKLDLVQKHVSSGAYYVDQVRDVQAILIEDKWRQYQRWRPWMPHTILGGSVDSITGQLVAKKRISTRSRDIRFDIRSADVTSDWIVQKRLALQEELRVYVLFGQPIVSAGERRSKSPTQRTSVTGLRRLSSEEQMFTEKITEQMKELDFVGLDIGVTPSGLCLIEVNRSPQFKRYNELSGSNLVADFWSAIQKVV